MSGIVIHRSRHAQQYVVVPNSIARDSGLSFTARGLLVMLLSLPPEWHVTTDMLAEDNPDSRGAIRKAMAELRETGYVELHHARGADGRTRRHLEVFDTPRTKRGVPAFGATSTNTLFPQVAPNAGKPTAARPAFGATREDALSPQVTTKRGQGAGNRSTGKYGSNPPRAHEAAIVRAVFPDATDDEIDTLIQDRKARGARNPAAVLAHEARNCALWLPCDRKRDGHSNACFGGDSGNCIYWSAQSAADRWCQCRCHTQPAGLEAQR